MRFNLILTIALVTQMAKTQMINLIDQTGTTIVASSTLSGVATDIKTWNGETLINDPGCFSTQDTGTFAHIKVDFGASKMVYTVLIITAGNADGSGYDKMSDAALYVGSNATTPTSNTLCGGNYNKIGETGFYDCFAQGRYLFLRTKSVNKIQICYMAAYNLPNFIPIGLAYTLPTGQNLNLLARTSPIGIRQGPGKREFSTTLLQPGEKWQINFGIARDVEGLTVISKVTQNLANFYRVFVDLTGSNFDNLTVCQDYGGVNSQKTKILEQFNCPRNGQFVTIQNQGTDVIEVYGAAIFAKATCTSCSQFTFIAPIINTVTLIYKVGEPQVQQNVLFGNCPYLQCELTFSFQSLSTPQERWGDNYDATYYTPWALQLKTTNINMIGTLNYKIGAKLNAYPTINTEISNFIVSVGKRETACQVTEINRTSEFIFPVSWYLVGYPELIVPLPKFTTTPSCDYWISYSLQAPNLEADGFSIVHATNALYVASATQKVEMYDYSLRFRTDDPNVAGDYNVVVMVQVIDVPSPPYTDVSPPVRLSIPVAVRDCKIVPNPATMPDIHIYEQRPKQTWPIFFSVTGSLCGNIAFTDKILTKSNTFETISFQDGTNLLINYDEELGWFSLTNIPSTYVGSYVVRLVLSLPQVPSFPAINYSFNLFVEAAKCVIVANPPTTADINLQAESPSKSWQIQFSVTSPPGTLCGAITVSEKLIKEVRNGITYDFQVSTNLMIVAATSLQNGQPLVNYDEIYGYFSLNNIPSSKVGQYVVTLVVSLPEVPDFTPFNYSFNVSIFAGPKCVVTSLTYAQSTTLTPWLYQILSGTQKLALPSVIQMPSCNYNILMSISNADASVTLTEPTTQKFEVNVLETDPTKTRTLSIQITATLNTEPYTGAIPILTLPIQFVYIPEVVPNVLKSTEFSLTSQNPNTLSLTEFASKNYDLETLESDQNCIQTNVENNPSLMISLGVSTQIRTVHLITAGNSIGQGFNSVATSYIWVGDSLKAEENVLCNVQVTESGFYTCIATGMYVFLQLQGYGKLSICHITAYSQFNVAPLGIAYTTSDPEADPQTAAVEKPLGIKLQKNVRDFSTISLSLTDSSQPFWQVVFGLQRNIFGVIVVLKVLVPDPLNGIKVYVTNGEALSSSNVCNFGQISNSSYVSIQCNLTGDRVQIVAIGGSEIELYQIGLMQSDQNCIACATDFSFITLPLLSIQIKVGDPIKQYSLLYGTCPQLDCQIVQTFTLLQDPLKLPQPFSLTKTGIEFKQITNNVVNTYEYSYSASLWTRTRRLNAVQITIPKVKIIISSDGCEITALDFAVVGSNYIAQTYFLKSGVVQYVLPVPVQTPNCNYHIIYTLKEAATDNYSIVQVSDKSFLQVDITDFAKANLILTVPLVVQVNYNPTAPYTNLATPIVFTISLLDCRLSKSLELIPDIQIKQSSDTVLINEKFTSISNCGALTVKITAVNKKTLIKRDLTGVSYDYAASQIKLYSYAAIEIGTHAMTVQASYARGFETEVNFNLIILEKTLETNATGQIGILLPGGIFLPLGPQPDIIKIEKTTQPISPVLQPDGTITIPSGSTGSDALTLLSIIAKLDLPPELLLAQVESLAPEYEQLKALSESSRTQDQQDFIDQFEYLISNNMDYIDQNPKYKFPGVIIPTSTFSSASRQIPLILPKPLEASLGPVSMMGVFRINFSAPVFMIKPQVLKNKNRLSVNVIWSKTDFVEDPSIAPKYTWKVLNVTESFIDVNITFASPLDISQGFKLDQLQVKIDNRYYFRRQTDGEPLSFRSLILQQDLIQQVPSERAFTILTTVSDKISSIRDSTGIVFIVFVIMNLPKSLFWGLHSCIQFMSMEPEHGASMPANAAFIFQQIKDIAELKIIPTKKLYDKLKWLKALAKNASAIWEAGFYFILVITCGFLIAILILLQKLADFCECGCKLHKIVIEKMKRKLMFNTIIRAAQLGYMFHVVTSLKGILNKKFEYNITKSLQEDLQDLKIKSSALNKFDKLNSVTYWLLMIFVFTYPIGVTLFLQIRGPKGLRSTEIKEQFGSWFMLINTKLRMNLLHTTVFLVRRLIVGISIAVLRAHYNFQLQILLVSCMAVCCYDIYTKPFVTGMLNNLELVNELLILFSVCVMHNFSDYIPDQNQRYSIGWVYCGIIISVLIMNFIFIGSYIVETIYDYLKKEFWKRYRNKTLPIQGLQKLGSKIQRLQFHNQKKEDQQKTQELEKVVGQAADIILDNKSGIGRSFDDSGEKRESSDSFKTDSDIEESKQLEEIKEEDSFVSCSQEDCSNENSNSVSISCSQQNSRVVSNSCNSPMKLKSKSHLSVYSASVGKSQQSQRQLLELSESILVLQTSSKLNHLMQEDQELFQNANSSELKQKQRIFRGQYDWNGLDEDLDQGQDDSINNEQYKIDEPKSLLKHFMRKNNDINKIIDRGLIDIPNLIGSLLDHQTERASEREETEDIQRSSQTSQEEFPRVNLDLSFNPQPDPLLHSQSPSPTKQDTQDDVQIQGPDVQIQDSDQDIDQQQENILQSAWLLKTGSNRQLLVSKLSQSVQDVPTRSVFGSKLSQSIRNPPMGSVFDQLQPKDESQVSLQACQIKDVLNSLIGLQASTIKDDIVLTPHDSWNTEEKADLQIKADFQRSPREKRGMNRQPKQGQRFKSNEGMVLLESTSLQNASIDDYTQNDVLVDVSPRRVTSRNPLQIANHFRILSEPPGIKDDFNYNHSRNQNYDNNANPMQSVSVSSSQDDQPSRRQSQNLSSRLSMTGEQIVRPRHLTLHQPTTQNLTAQFLTATNFYSRGVDKSRESMRVERRATRKKELREMVQKNIISSFNSPKSTARHQIVALENKKSVNRFESDFQKLHKSLQPVDPAQRQLQSVVQNYFANSKTYDKDKLKKVIKLGNQESKLVKLEAKLSKAYLLKKDLSKREASLSPK